MSSNLITADNGVSSGVTGITQSAGSDGTLQLRTTTSGGSAVTALTLNNSQQATFANTINVPNTFGFKNRIINGGLTISQYNGTSAITPANNVYTIDRWVTSNSAVASKYSIAQSSVAPVGFSNSILITSLSAYTVGSTESFTVQQYIEGFNTADLSFGTASAKTVTLSAWVQSSLTGTFGGSIENSAQSRSYPFSYSIPVANTWTQISITIPGDTTGTWIGATNGIGMQVRFSFGAGSTYQGTANAWVNGDIRTVTGQTSVVGTNGATFYITGVQLEVGTQATSFDYRPYGTELVLCQRYYYSFYAGDTIGYSINTTLAVVGIPLPSTMRVGPSSLTITPSNFNYFNGSNSLTVPSAIGLDAYTITYVGLVVTTTGLTAGQGGRLASLGTTPSYSVGLSAEL